MAIWFEAKIRYDKMGENGMVRKVTEPYLVDSVTCMNAEEIVVEKMAQFISGEFEVKSVKKTKIAEIFYDESDYADKWYLVKFDFISLDERSGKEKKSRNLILVQAGDFENALGRFQDGMKGVMSDYRIFSITETLYQDVFPYEYPQDGEK